MRRGDLLFKFLELVGELGGSAEDHLVGFLSAGYGASAKELDYKASQHRRQREKAKEKNAEELRLRQRYHVMKSGLKKDGLIVDVYHGDKHGLVLTQEGRFRLRQLSKDMAGRLAVPNYKLESGSRAIIVAFDIPEEDRRKRAWLRSALKNMGLKMIQQSVWIGKGALPQTFLDDLRNIQLIEFVEIFEVTKTGSLTHVL